MSSMPKPKGKELEALVRAYKHNLTATWSEEKQGYIVPSSSSPGDSYLVKFGNCYCTGFLRWGMCQHVAMANEHAVAEGKAWRCNCGEVFYKGKTYNMAEYDRVHGAHLLGGETTDEPF